MKKLFPALVILAMLLLSSCSSNKLMTRHVAYQSVRTTVVHDSIPADAEIAVTYGITPSGQLHVYVTNQTDKIMQIDQTMSFFVNTNSVSVSYYDPTMRTTSTTNVSSGTSGASVNLGAVGSALGIGGPLGMALSGINVGGAETQGKSVTNITQISDMPRVALAPHAYAEMSKAFFISGIGTDALSETTESYVMLSDKTSPLRFSVCISYSLDDGETFKQIKTDFFMSSQLVEPVTKIGIVNDALRNIYIRKPDALYEPWSLFYFAHNISSSRHTYGNGYLFDYQ